MSDKNRNVLMLLAGGYLVYVGCRLTIETQKSHPTNEMLLIAFGVIFALYGVFVMGIQIRRFWLARKKNKEELAQKEMESLEAITDTPRKAIPVRTEKAVQMVKLEAEDEQKPDQEEPEEYEEEELLSEEEDFSEGEDFLEEEEAFFIEYEEEDDFIEYEEEDDLEEDDLTEEKDETCESDNEEESEEIRLERI